MACWTQAGDDWLAGWSPAREAEDNVVIELHGLEEAVFPRAGIACSDGKTNP